MKGGCRCESASTLNYFVLSKQICTFGHSNRKKKDETNTDNSYFMGMYDVGFGARDEGDIR